MTIIALNSALFALPLGAFDSGFALDFESELEGVIDAANVNWQISRLSSRSIVLSGRGTEYDPVSNSNVRVHYDVTISGQGIKPVTSFQALQDAIDAGIATGALNKITFSRSGAELIDLSISSAGYTLTSGGQSLDIVGHTPTTFTQFFALADQFDQLAHVDYLTNRQRNQLFLALESYGVSSLSLSDNGTEAFGIDISSTSVSLTINGHSFALTGTFPTTVGTALSVLWDLAKVVQSGGPIDNSTFAGLSVTSLTISAPSGTLLCEITDLFGTTDQTIVDGHSVDAFIFDNLLSGGPDYIYQGQFDTRNLALAGYGGDDTLIAGTGNDLIYGGDGNDTLEGGLGNDSFYGGAGFDTFSVVFDFFGTPRDATVDLSLTVKQDTGYGRDLLISIEAAVTGNGNDSVRGNLAANSLVSGSGNDLLIGLGGGDFLNGVTGTDRLNGGSGNDVLLGGQGNDTLTGGAGQDDFVFDFGSFGQDRITDFKHGQDHLLLLGMNTSLTVRQLVNQFASVVGSDVVFDFGSGETMTLVGLTSTQGLAADLILA